MTSPQLRILIVDDEPMTRRAIARALRQASSDATVDEAGDGASALAMLQRAPFDCVLLDHNLPDTTGLHVLRDAHARGIRVPFIVVTGAGDETVAVEVMKAGAADYIPKGRLSPEVLSRSVGQAVRLHRAEQRAEDARAALRDNEHRLSRILETAVDAILILDQAGHVVFHNPAAAVLFGPMVDVAALLAPGGPLRLVVETGEAQRAIEMTHGTRPDGGPVTLSVNAAPLPREDWSVGAVVLSIRDVTDQKRAEAARLRSEHRFRRMFESGMLGILFWHVDGRILDANDAFLRIVGYARDDLREGRIDWARLTPPEYVEQDRRSIAQIMEKGYCDAFAKEYIHKDGSRVQIVIGGAFLEGSREEGIAYLVDVSDRKRFLEALRERDARMQSLVESLPFDCWARDEHGRMIMQNVHSRRLWGDLVGRAWDEQDVPGEALDDWRENNRRAMAGQVVEHEVNYAIDGVERTYYAIVAPIREGERTRGLVGANIDITETKRTERALRESEERYRTLFEQSAFAVVVLDPQTMDILEFNTAAHAMLGYSREEFAGKRIADIEVGRAPEDVAAIGASVRARGSAEFEARLRTRSGDVRDMFVTLRAIRLNNRPRILSISHDVTERNRLKEQLLQSQKMEAVGRLAGGVAHDFNNLLAVISGYSESMLRRMPDGDPLRLHVGEINQAAERGGALTRQLLAFSRRQEVRLAPVDLNVVVRSLQTMLRRVTPERITIDVKPQDALRPILADRGQLEQVVINLAINARDAMPDGGTLSIATASTELTDVETAGTDLEPGPYTRLVVRDTGVGMDDATRARIFEPFFTTKEQQGTGLGLSIVYGIVQQSNGAIRVHSAPGQGTTFELLFPCVATTDAP